MIYEIWKSNGDVNEIHTEKPLTLSEQQKLVGGYITYMNIKVGGEDAVACVNDEGLLQDLPRNELLPAIVGDAIIGKIRYGKFIGLTNLI